MTDTLTTNIIDMTQQHTVTAEQLLQLHGDDPTLRLLDVRTGAEFETAHIPGSVNIPLDVMSEHATEVAGVDGPLVIVCQSGLRSEQARSDLAAAGRSSSIVLEGGLVGWEAAGGDVVRGEVERWAMDRQVRLAAGSLVLAGMAASTVVPNAKWFAGAIGGGLTFSALSNTCAMGTMLGKLPYNQTEACDIDQALGDLNKVG